jgi:hypothetical protein
VGGKPGSASHPSAPAWPLRSVAVGRREPKKLDGKGACRNRARTVQELRSSRNDPKRPEKRRRAQALWHRALHSLGGSPPRANGVSDLYPDRPRPNP